MFEAKKCNRITGMIKTRFKSKDLNLLSQLYKVYILPIIGYASEVWAPTYKIQLEFLEKIQKRYCQLTGSKSYSGSCKALSLITVEDFLNNKDLKYMHKIMSNNTCLNFNDFFKTSDSGKTRSSTEAKINLPKARSIIKNIHSLPDLISICPSANCPSADCPSAICPSRPLPLAVCPLAN
jgi:hypothetical protein